MSVKYIFSRGLELGRSAFQLGLFKPAGRVVAKLRGERFRAGPSVRTAQPQAFLPSRYRYYRTSLKGLAAQLQSAGFRRRFGGGSPRSRAVFLAFGVGVVLIEKQLEDDRHCAVTCQEIQVWYSEIFYKIIKAACETSVCKSAKCSKIRQTREPEETILNI